MNICKPFFIALTLLAIASPSFAANVTNNLIGVGPKTGLINPHFCIKNEKTGQIIDLAPGETKDGNAASGNPYFVGGDVRFNSCSTNDPYLGYLGYNSAGTITYSPPGVQHIIVDKPAINNGSLTGTVKYTPIKSNFNIVPVPPRPNQQYVGVNLAGLEFSKMIDPYNIPNLSEEDAATSLSDLAETQSFLKAGVNTVRVPISWGFIQLEGPGKGNLNLDYFNSYIKPVLETLTAAKVNAIVDLHAYMHYPVFGKQYSGYTPEGKLDGTLVTDPALYQDVWTKLFALIKNDPKIDMNYIMLDLMNEPTDDVPNDSVFTIQVALIKSLRAAGFQGYILVEGNFWSGLHSWTTKTWTSKDGKTTYTNATLFTRDNFAKAGITDLSKILINVHQYFDADYSGNHAQCLRDITTIGPDGFNLQAFVNYLNQNKMQAFVTEFGTGKDKDSCNKTLDDFMQYLTANSAQGKDYGFIGWTYWASGHAWGTWGNTRITPDSYQMDVVKKYLQPVN